MVAKQSPEMWLRDRAESYWQDSKALADMGDQPMAVAYRAIAEELRKCAAEYRTDEDGFVEGLIAALAKPITDDGPSGCIH